MRSNIEEHMVKHHMTEIEILLLLLTYFMEKTQGKSIIIKA